MNLLDNALKYTPAGKDIIITAEQHQDMVMLSIVDSGPGISEADRERIFERFAQVAAGAPTRRGLGLTFCRLAVEAHGGEIWVESGQDSCGSRFIFTIPLHNS